MCFYEIIKSRKKSLYNTKSDINHQNNEQTEHKKHEITDILRKNSASSSVPAGCHESHPIHRHCNSIVTHHLHAWFLCIYHFVGSCSWNQF